MGRLPYMQDIRTTRKMISEFGGYNHSLQINENEFDGMKNMSSSFNPVLSPRKKRGIFTQLTRPNGLTAKSNLFWVDGGTLFHNGASVLGLTLQDNEKQFVSMGAYLLIWPDKVYYNTADQTHGKLEAAITIPGDISCSLTKQDGTSFGTPTVSADEPNEPENGDLWLDTSSNTHVLKQFAEASGTWVPVATTYVKIAAENIGAQFKQYDGVKVSGFANTALNGDFILYGADTNYIIITGLIDTTVTQTGGVTVSRTVPDMDFLTESENRVWGCSSEKHEIYACKLGDPFNWHCFMGLASDSYTATIGSDGDFTGICTHRGYVCIWKEDMLHKVAGSKPANYQITNTVCRGVEKGSEKSMSIVNEVLFYKSRNGICAYDGALPYSVSDNLGDVRYRNAVGGSLGNKYFVSMLDTAGTAHLFVYDMSVGLWHREDNMHVSYFATHEGELFFLDADTNRIMTVNGRLSVHEGGVKHDAEYGAAEGAFDWLVESGDIGLGLPDNKYISKLLIRMEMAEAGTINVSLNYDGAEAWKNTVVVTTQALRTIMLPIIPRRCDHMRIRIFGTGDCKIYSITKTIEEGES